MHGKLIFWWANQKITKKYFEWKCPVGWIKLPQLCKQNPRASVGLLLRTCEHRHSRGHWTAQVTACAPPHSQWVRLLLNGKHVWARGHRESKLGLHSRPPPSWSCAQSTRPSWLAWDCPKVPSSSPQCASTAGQVQGEQCCSGGRPGSGCWQTPVKSLWPQCGRSSCC